jgi:hypothetical protein
VDVKRLLIIAVMLMASTAWGEEKKAILCDFKGMSNCKITITLPEPWFSKGWSLLYERNDYDIGVNISGGIHDSVITMLWYDDKIIPPPKGICRVWFDCKKKLLLIPIGKPKDILSPTGFSPTGFQMQD